VHARHLPSDDNFGASFPSAADPFREPATSAPSSPVKTSHVHLPNAESAPDFHNHQVPIHDFPNLTHF
jgi:hypothetical protein